MLCAGNQLQYCGAGNRLNLYTLAPSSTSTSVSSTTKYTSTSSASSSASAAVTTSSSIEVVSSTTPTSSSTIGPTVSGYAYQGCYTEATSGRALSSKSFNYAGMTIESCAANCTAYAYFGVEYGRECYCGATLSADSEKTVGDGLNGACKMACSGNKNQFCGDGGKLSLYFSSAPGKLRGPPETVEGDANYIYYGCVGEPPNSRALGGGGFFANDTLTVGQCLDWAAANGFRYAGLEYSRECWGANTLSPQATDKTSGACANLCGGNQQTYCGGPGALSLYVTNSTAIYPGAV